MTYELHKAGTVQPKDKPAGEPSNFLAVLQLKEIKDGTLTDLSDNLREAAVAAAATGKKASVTLTLTIEPKNGALHFSAKTKTTIPMPEENLCLFFLDKDGNLTRQDPNQKEFDLREVPGGKTEPATAPASTATAS